MGGQTHLRVNSLGGLVTKRMCIILTVWSENKSIQETTLFHQDNVLYAEERVIDGENVSI